MSKKSLNYWSYTNIKKCNGQVVEYLLNNQCSINAQQQKSFGSEHKLYERLDEMWSTTKNQVQQLPHKYTHQGF